MKNKLQELIKNHKLICEEVSYELNELSQMDRSKFSKIEWKDIELSIDSLQSELSLRNAFVSELQTLL
jgi:hypothetical protein